MNMKDFANGVFRNAAEKIDPTFDPDVFQKEATEFRSQLLNFVIKYLEQPKSELIKKNPDPDFKRALLESDGEDTVLTIIEVVMAAYALDTLSETFKRQYLSALKEHEKTVNDVLDILRKSKATRH